MGTLVSTNASSLSAYGNTRSVFNLRDGTVCVAILDGVIFRIYTSPAGGGTWTLRASFTASFPASGIANWWASNIGDTDNVHFCWRDTNSALRWVRATWATGNVYTFGTAETVADALVPNLGRYDIEVANGDVPIIATLKAASPASFYTYIRKTNTSTWLLAYTLQISNNSWNNGWFGISLSRDSGGPVSGSQRFAFAVAVPDKTRYQGDVVGLGLNLNLSTGAVTNSPVIISNLWTATSKNVNRDFQLFSPVAGRYDLAQAVGQGSLDLRVSRYSNTAVVFNNSVAPIFAGKARTAYARASNEFDRVKFAHTGSAILFLYNASLSDNQVHSVQLTCRVSDTKMVWVAPNDPGTNHDWWDTYTSTPNQDQGVTAVYAGGNRNLVPGGVNLARAMTVMYRSSDKKWTYKENPQVVAPYTYYPAGGGTTDTNTPTVQVQVLGQQRPQSRIKPYIQIAKDSAFTQSLKTIVGDDTEYQAIPRTGVNNVVNKLIMSEQVSVSSPLAQGLWYIHTAGYDPWGRPGAFGATTSFNVSHPANAIHLAPANGDSLNYGPGNGDITLNWDFSSAWAGSSQTSYQVVVESIADITAPVGIVDTGQVVSSSQSATVNIPSTYKSTSLRWKVRVWDEDAVVGPYSNYALFEVADASTVVFVDPVDVLQQIISGDASTFEGGTTGGWALISPDSGTGATIANSAVRAHSGTKSLLWTAGTASWGTNAGVSQSFPTVVGSYYTVTAWLYQTTRISNGVRLAWSSTNSNGFTYSTTSVNAGNFIQLTMTFQAVDTATTISAVVDASGAAITSAQTFNLDDVVMTTPIHEVVSTPTPTISWTFTPPVADPSVTQAKYRVIIYDSLTNVTIVDSNWVPSSLTSYVVPSGTIGNNGGYTVIVGVEDTNKLQSVTAPTLFTTQWASPAAPVATFDNSNYVPLGYVSATWTDAAMDLLGFISWRVYRRVTGDTAWVLLREYFEDASSYTYYDYSAVTGISYDYTVVQTANRFGSQIESVYNVQTLFAQSDDYWLVGIDDTDPKLRLENVTGDSYDDEYEEEVIELIGRGRHVEYGTHWGYKGTLTCKLYDSSNNGPTARVKRQALMDAKKLRKSFLLRNPFGDIWLVAVGDLSIGRIAGVGQREFVELSIPYTQLDADASY